MNTNLTDETVPFTKASQGDGQKTTVSLPALDRSGVKIEDAYGNPRWPSMLTQGDTFNMGVEGRDCVWKVNRSGKTACTYGFPYRRPSVGRASNRRPAKTGKLS